MLMAVFNEILVYILPNKKQQRWRQTNITHSQVHYNSNIQMLSICFSQLVLGSLYQRLDNVCSVCVREWEGESVSFLVPAGSQHRKLLPFSHEFYYLEKKLKLVVVVPVFIVFSLCLTTKRCSNCFFLPLRKSVCVDTESNEREKEKKMVYHHHHQHYLGFLVLSTLF